LARKNTAADDDKHIQDKLRGGYYTSPVIAKHLCDWAIRSKKDHVLEPSCGDGVFLEAAAHRLIELGTAEDHISRQLAGVEIIPAEATIAIQSLEKAIGRHEPDVVHMDDFFSWINANLNERFDAVVGNPPFIRYQNFPEPSRSDAMSLLNSLGFRPNKLTNTWVPFVAGSTVCMAPGGRLAMVLPAELLQVSYASQLRSFLVDRFERIDILTCNDLLFERAEQEIVLFLAEGYREKDDSKICRINLSEVPKIEELFKKIANLGEDEEKLVNHESEKWLKYFLTSTEIAFMRELRYSEDIVNFSHHAAIDVGIVTGRNEFFVLSKNEIESYSLGDYVIPLVGRSAQLKGSIIKKKEWKELAEVGERVYLLHIDPNSNGSLPDGVKKYIALGEEEKFHTGYKCSIRTPWYKVPSVWEPDCFLFRQIYDFPRVILNMAGAVSTDTIHRMTCKSSRKKFVPNLYTHLTAASAEIEGRSYGGGVLELEPTEAEKLLTPKQLTEGLPIEEIDQLIRAGKIQEMLEENDNRILVDGLGLSKKDCTMLKDIWAKMRDRRKSRSRRKKQ
jgi:adenine-specific DNA methylase